MESSDKLYKPFFTTFSDEWFVSLRPNYQCTSTLHITNKGNLNDLTNEVIPMSISFVTYEYKVGRGGESKQFSSLQWQCNCIYFTLYS